VYLKAPVASCHEELTVSTPTYYHLPCCHDHQPVDGDAGGSCRFCVRCDKWIRPHKWDEDCWAVKSVFEGGLSSGLIEMAKAAWLYNAIWEPDEIGITKAKQLIEPLKTGLDELLARPKKYRLFNAKHEWVTYDHFVTFVRAYLAACEEYPDADVIASR
jgi:hypothetical protein